MRRLVLLALVALIVVAGCGDRIGTKDTTWTVTTNRGLQVYGELAIWHGSMRVRSVDGQQTLTIREDQVLVIRQGNTQGQDLEAWGDKGELRP